MDKELKHLQSQAKKLRTTDLRAVKEELLEEQNYRCALCNIDLLSDLRNACVDHCHRTGFIRAVLCRNCNRGEGKVKTVATMCKRAGEMVHWLMRLVAYWHKHATPQTNWIHPKHKTEEEKRIRRNKKARERRKASK